MHFWILGNPENRRVSLFLNAALSMGLQTPSVYAYQDFLLSGLLPDKMFLPNTIIRIESPGENVEVRKLLIEKGLQNKLTKADIDTIRDHVNDHGRIGYGNAWYKGFSETMLHLDKELNLKGNAIFMNSPRNIISTFNKVECHKIFNANQIPVPRLLAYAGSYEELKNQMIQNKILKVFVKPAHSSSASGVVAFRLSGKKMEAVSSATIVKNSTEFAIYNFLKIQKYTNEKEISTLLDFILQENTVIEEWIPKAVIENSYFDFRVLVINGQAKHVVPRLSTTPITNLHLGNKRGVLEVIEHKIGKAKLLEVKAMAEKAAVCFPESLYLGVDVLLASDLKTIKILEVNAFGDLLPNLLHEGMDTYTTEINEILKSRD